MLLVDASQGVEAQTVANLYLALEYELEMIPVINKIDLPAADVDRVSEEIETDLGLDATDAIPVSAKQGTGIGDLLEAIVERLPAPEGDPEAPLKALIFDAQYDAYRGVVVLCRIVDGSMRKGQKVRFMHSDKSYDLEEVGLLQLKRVAAKELGPGAVGYFIAGIKTVRDIVVGDTVTEAANPAEAPLPGYKEAKPVVFSSIYPMSTDDYADLTKALEKLVINDAALTYEKDSSAALGYGFRCGFLGLLHLEVVQERLQREFNLALLLSAPSVSYKVYLEDGEMQIVDNPALFPDPGTIDYAEEPFIKASVIIPERYVGSVMELCRERRGEQTVFNYLSVGRVELTSEMPLAEVMYDFYDRLKSVTQGYGSFDYEIKDYRRTDLVKVDILVNNEKVDALSQLVHRERARMRAMHYCERLSETIPRHQFKIAIQGAIGGQIIARTNVAALRKDVTAKCYGGDISRKRKTAGKAEGREEAHEAGRQRRDPARRLRGGAEDRQGQLSLHRRLGGSSRRRCQSVTPQHLSAKSDLQELGPGTFRVGSDGAAEATDQSRSEVGRLGPATLDGTAGTPVHHLPIETDQVPTGAALDQTDLRRAERRPHRGVQGHGIVGCLASERVAPTGAPSDARSQKLERLGPRVGLAEADIVQQAGDEQTPPGPASTPSAEPRPGPRQTCASRGPAGGRCSSPQQLQWPARPRLNPAQPTPRGQALGAGRRRRVDSAVARRLVRAAAQTHRSLEVVRPGVARRPCRSPSSFGR